MMFKNKWSEDEINQVMNLWGEGKSIEDIADNMGRSSCAIAHKVLSDKYAAAYQALWVIKHRGSDDTPVVSITEIVLYLEGQEEYVGSVSQDDNSSYDGLLGRANKSC